MSHAPFTSTCPRSPLRPGAARHATTGISPTDTCDHDGPAEKGARSLETPSCRLPGHTVHNAVAVCTSSGTLQLGTVDGPLWDLQVDHHLFAIGRCSLLQVSEGREGG